MKAHKKKRPKSSAKRKAETPWRTYEQVTAYLLNRFHTEFGLDLFEGKQKILTESGTYLEIDAKGVDKGNQTFVIVECRQRKEGRSQEEVLALIGAMIETGAVGGIMVSPVEPQKGAKILAEHRNIVHVRLTGDSTPTQFLIQFLKKLFAGIAAKSTSSAGVTTRFLIECGKCHRNFEISGEEMQKIADEKRTAVGLLCDNCINANPSP
jgi:hypothetical protein